MSRIECKSFLSLQDDVVKFLESNKFQVTSLAYNAALPSTLVESLSHCYNPTSLFLRSLPNLIALYQPSNVVYHVELRSNPNEKHRNMVLELSSYLADVILCRELEVQCLYTYRDTVLKKDRGFWVCSPPKLSHIIIPTDNTYKEYFVRLINKHLPGVSFKVSKVAGIDPFVVVKEESLQELPDWRDLILQNKEENL